MTTHPETHGTGVRSEEDRIPTRAVLGVGVAAVVVFFLASLVTVSYMRARVTAHGPITIPPEIGQSKIGMVEQQLFQGGPLRGERDRARRLERLGSYGWVDRGAGIAHMPIEDAMQLVAKGIRPMPAPRPQREPTITPGGQP